MTITYKSNYGGFLINIDKATFYSILEDHFELKELWTKDIWYTDNIKYYVDKERTWYTNEKQFVQVHKWINWKLWLPKGHFYLVWAPFLAILVDKMGVWIKKEEQNIDKSLRGFNFVKWVDLYPHQKKIVSKLSDTGQDNNQLILIREFWSKLLQTRITYANINNVDKIVSLTKKYFPYFDNDIFSGYIISPARSGKTIIMLALAQKLGLRTLVIVDKELIFNQFKSRIKQFTDLDPNTECRFYQGAKSFGKFDEKVQIGVGMIQTLAKLFDHTNTKKLEIIKEELSKYDLVLVDEAHTVATDTFMKALSWLSFEKIFGFTATKMRGDGNHRLLEYYIGETIMRIEQKEVSDMVYDIQVFPRKFVINDVLWFIKTKRGSYDTTIDKWAVKKLYNDNRRNNQIFKDVENAIDKQRLIIVIWETLDHLDYLAHMLNIRYKEKKKWTNKDIAYVINSKTKKKDREAILEAFDQAWKDRAEGKEYSPKVLLATASLLGKGFDWPYFDTIFLVAPLWAKKKERWDDGRAGLVQVVNRIGNKVPWKKQPICVDYVDVEPEEVLINMARSRYWNVYRDKYWDLKHNFKPSKSWNEVLNS